MTNKMTINDYYNALLNLTEVQAHPDLVDFINSRKEVNSKKNANKKQTATQKANEEIKNEILDEVLSTEPMTVTQITKVLAEKHPDISLNKVNALVRQLKLDGSVIRTEEKGVAYFTLA